MVPGKESWQKPRNVSCCVILVTGSRQKNAVRPVAVRTGLMITALKPCTGRAAAVILAGKPAMMLELSVVNLKESEAGTRFRSVVVSTLPRQGRSGGSISPRNRASTSSGGDAVWWNEENREDLLTAHESWREYADHCLTHDPMPHTGEWHQRFDFRAINSAEECLPDAKEARGSTPLLPTGSWSRHRPALAVCDPASPRGLKGQGT